MLSGTAIDGDTVILIVENDHDDKDMLIAICREVGFALKNIREGGFDRENVSVPAEIEKTIAILNRGEVDLVLLDLALDETHDWTPAVVLLEKWNKETRRKKVPVIVVSAFTYVLEPAALQSCAAVIMKPGPTDAERAQFTAFLKHAIRTAIAQRSDGATLGDRIRQQFDRIVSRIVPGSPHIHLAPGVSFPVSNTLMRAGVAIFVVVCWAVFLIVYSKSRGWPVKPIMWLFGALLLVAILIAVIPGKRSH